MVYSNQRLIKKIRLGAWAQIKYLLGEHRVWIDQVYECVKRGRGNNCYSPRSQERCSHLEQYNNISWLLLCSNTDALDKENMDNLLRKRKRRKKRYFSAKKFQSWCLSPSLTRPVFKVLCVLLDECLLRLHTIWSSTAQTGQLPAVLFRLEAKTGNEITLN